jgi:glucosylceramidase
VNPFAANSLIFRNPDGSIVLQLYNPFARVFTIAFELEDEQYCFDLEPKSVNSMILK